ncbi:hypothetical protein LCGC14_0516960 [marine sediment metagenome]|uniref:Uncharacterized protein n=1 Tax=marine sediment metagenome TaxID=412755 RepID=A0A0F9SI18_9ZZZZ
MVQGFDSPLEELINKAQKSRRLCLDAMLGATHLINEGKIELALEMLRHIVDGLEHEPGIKEAD